MQKLITFLFIIVAIIHLLPLSGVVGAKQLKHLYGLDFQDPNLVILMRHRAVLFGLLGAFFLFAAFKTDYQLLGLIGGFVSTLSFLAIAWSTPGYNAAIHKVFVADIVAVICLLIAAVLRWIQFQNIQH